MVFIGPLVCCLSANTGKEKNMKRREQAKLHALDEDQSEVQWGEGDYGDHDVLQFNVKFASLKEQALFYGDCDRYIVP
jgi:hypothetical protein